MANFIRDKQVDITTYLPAYLSKDGAFKAVCDSDSLEHEQVRLAIIDVFKQFNVETATWGLGMWEEVLGLHPIGIDTIASRRAKILVKIRSRRTSTVAMMTEIVHSYGGGYVEEHNDRYYFNVISTATEPEQLRHLKSDILYYKPAHLGLNVYLGFGWNGYITFNGKHQYNTQNVEWRDE